MLRMTGWLSGQTGGTSNATGAMCVMIATYAGKAVQRTAPHW
jgi:hypothetical protein